MAKIFLSLRAARTTRSLASGTAIRDVVETYAWFQNGSSTFSEYSSRNAADGSMKEPLFLRNSRKLSSFTEHFLILFIILMTKAFFYISEGKNSFRNIFNKVLWQIKVPSLKFGELIRETNSSAVSPIVLSSRKEIVKSYRNQVYTLTISRFLIIILNNSLEKILTL